MFPLPIGIKRFVEMSAVETTHFAKEARFLKEVSLLNYFQLVLTPFLFLVSLCLALSNHSCVNCPTKMGLSG